MEEKRKNADVGVEKEAKINGRRQEGIGIIKKREENEEREVKKDKMRGVEREGRERNGSIWNRKVRKKEKEKVGGKGEKCGFNGRKKELQERRRKRRNEDDVEREGK